MQLESLGRGSGRKSKFTEMFIVNSCDLNVDVFNESTNYHVLLDLRSSRWVLEEAAV
jgi:hypothetical protein